MRNRYWLDRIARRPRDGSDHDQFRPAKRAGRAPGPAGLSVDAIVIVAGVHWFVGEPGVNLREAGMRKPPRKFGDWGRSASTGYLELVALTLAVFVALIAGERYL
jgi:hypothetical protein